MCVVLLQHAMLLKIVLTQGPENEAELLATLNLTNSSDLKFKSKCSDRTFTSDVRQRIIH